MDKSLFYFNTDLYMCCTYIPPKESTLLNSEEFDMFERIERDVSKYQLLGKILLTGDFNSRTSTEPDFITLDRFLNTDLFIQSDLERYPRVNKDHVLDAHESKLIELCIAANLFIANGRLHGDRSIGNYTFINNNGMSVVDYLILQKNDFSFISNFDILLPSDLSDHNALHFSIQFLNPSDKASKKRQ